MDTNDCAMRTLERIVLDLQVLREDLRTQCERLDAQSERLMAQSERLTVQDQRSAGIEASLVRMHASLETGLERSHREAFAISSSFTLMSERVAFATYEEAEHGRRLDERLDRIDRQLDRIGQHVMRLDERMGAIDRRG